jgi:uncharacterized protein (TIGR00730 family)
MKVFVIILIVFVVIILNMIFRYFLYRSVNKLLIKSSKKYLNLTVFCSSKDGINEEYNNEIKKLINSVNEKKYRIVNGGDHGGLIHVVNETFSKKNGNILSINFKINKGHYVASNIFDRQRKLIEYADIILVLPGGMGTLSELMDTILLNEVSKPENKLDILIFNYKGVYNLLLKHFEEMKEKKFIDSDYMDKFKIRVFDNYQDIIHYLNMFGKETKLNC